MKVLNNVKSLSTPHMIIESGASTTSDNVVFVCNSYAAIPAKPFLPHSNKVKHSFSSPHLFIACENFD